MRAPSAYPARASSPLAVFRLRGGYGTSRGVGASAEGGIHRVTPRALGATESYGIDDGDAVMVRRHTWEATKAEIERLRHEIAIFEQGHRESEQEIERLQAALADIRSGAHGNAGICMNCDTIAQVAAAALEKAD